MEICSADLPVSWNADVPVRACPMTVRFVVRISDAGRSVRDRVKIFSRSSNRGPGGPRYSRPGGQRYWFIECPLKHLCRTLWRRQVLEQAKFAGQPLQARADGGRGRHQRQADMVAHAAHQRQYGLHRAGVGVPEVGVDQPRVAPLDLARLGSVAAQGGVDHAAHLGGNLVGGHADQPMRADANRGQRQIVVAAEDLKPRGRERTNSAICGSLPLDSLMAWIFGAASARRTTVSGSRFTPVRPGML